MAQVNFSSLPTHSSSFPSSELQRIDELFAEFKAVPNSSDAEKKQEEKSLKIAKLREAYKLCIPGSGDKLTRLSMILGEFAILHYAVGPQVSGITFADVTKFSFSKEILTGALQALLTRIGANEFTSALYNELPNSPQELVDFAAIEASFIKADKDALIQKAQACDFTTEQRVHLSRMLRYLNGAARTIRGHFEKREMNTADKAFTRNALYLAHEFAHQDPVEYWELMYNDWADVFEAEGNYNEKLETHRQWLLNHVVQDSQRARVYNKFYRDEEGVRKSLHQCVEIIRENLSPEKFVALQAILKGENLNPVEIEAVAKTLCQLDLHGKLTISWFAIVPSNLSRFLMEKPANHRKEIEGLLRLSVALVNPDILAGEKHFNYDAIMANWNRWVDLCDMMKAIPIASQLTTEAGSLIQEVSNAITHNIPITDVLKKLEESRKKLEQAKQIFLLQRAIVENNPQKSTIVTQLLGFAETLLAQNNTLAEMFLKQ